MLYEIDLDDGRTVTLESDSDPTEEQVHAALGSYQAPTPDVPTSFAPGTSSLSLPFLGSALPSFMSGPAPTIDPRQLALESRARRGPEIIPPTSGEVRQEIPPLDPVSPGPISTLVSELSTAPVGIGTFGKFEGQTLSPGSELRRAQELAQGEGRAPIGIPTPTAAFLAALPEGKVKDLSTGSYNAAANVFNFFLSPAGWGMLGIGDLPPAAQRALSAGFAFDMATKAPEELAAGDEAFKLGDLQGAAQHWLGGAASLGFAGGAGRHALAPRKLSPGKTPPIIEREAQNAIQQEAVREAPAEVQSRPPDVAGRVEAKVPEVREVVPDADLTVSIQSPMQLGENTMPGYVQVDSIRGGKNEWSSNPDKLKTEGYDMPTTAELLTLPQGRYTMAEAKAKLAEQSSNTNAQPKAEPSNAAGVVGKTPSPAAQAAPKSDLVSRLESLKFKEADAALLDAGEYLSSGLNLPHPELLKAIGKDVWNKAIDVAIAGVKAGKEIKLAVEDALAHLKANSTGKFDESQARANLESIFPETATSGESVRMRKLSERATEAPQIPEPVQETIKGSPESYYRQQSMSKVEGAVRDMSDADLAAVSKDSDIYTAAKLELSTRQLDAGNFEAGTRTFQELSTELTRLGQVINQAKLFQALRPEHVVDVLNKDLSKNGKDLLTPDQAERVRKTAEERIKKQSELNKATDEWTKDPTDANAVKAEKALDESNKAALDEQKLVNQFQSRSTAAILKSILQGNLLTPISQVANVIGNINFSPFRAGVRTIASGIDMIDAMLRNRPRKVSVAPLSGTKASVEGLIRGVKQIPGILAKGSGETIKGETRAGLHPLRAWVKQFAKNPDIPTVGGKIPFSERVNLAIEGTFGVPAEIMLRGLGAGDIAFTEMARSRLISEQSRLQKLTPEQARMAKNFPELLFDKATLERINSETRGAVFQRQSTLLSHFTSWLKSKGDFADLLAATVAPYKLTPYNIVGEILSYNPLIAMAKTAIEAKRGNIRSAEMNAAKVLVGSTLVAAGYWLYDKGLIAPSMDTRDEQQKARVLAGEILPPNHINVSGLDRAMKGGDPSFKPGDETVDVFRAGGLAGSMFYMMANIGRDAETKPETDNQIMSLIKNSTLEQARFGLNQSFLKGVAGLLDAVRDGEGDTYLQQYAGTVLSIPLPNTLSVLSRAERQYKVDISADTLKKQVENVVRTRLGFAGMDDYLPLKRGLWGEPLPETPKDRNALVYHFFDITKNKQVSSDPLPVELYRLWRKTADTSVIPSPPAKALTAAKETYVLTPEQRSSLAESVGTARRDIASQIVVNPNWHKASDEFKIKMLEQVYDTGLKIGKAKFLAENQGQLEKKAEKAGFNK